VASRSRCSDDPKEARVCTLLTQLTENDRRNPPARGRVLLGGKVVYGNGDMSHDCVIRDLTENGARIKLESAISLPKQIYLIDYKRGVAHIADIAWSAPPNHGLSLKKAMELRDEDSKDPFFKLMRRLWLERVAR